MCAHGHGVSRPESVDVASSCDGRALLYPNAAHELSGYAAEDVGLPSAACGVVELAKRSIHLRSERLGDDTTPEHCEIIAGRVVEAPASCSADPAPGDERRASPMPGVKTELTEIVTGLGMLAYPSAHEAIERRPPELSNVQAVHWDRITTAARDPAHRYDVFAAWQNGRAFLRASDGLRERTPRIIEWKGPHKPPGYDFLPADLRIDHVFLVSCKYLSQVLANLSPAHLFERALALRGARSHTDWFLLVSEDAYRNFYEHVRGELSGSVPLPPRLEDLTAAHREELKACCARTWPGSLGEAYDAFSADVSRASAKVWNEAVPTLAHREELLWRILRFSSAPYFILGSAGGASLRLRVATPWDWRQRFVLKEFTIAPQAGSQPRVRWAAEVEHRGEAETVTVEGHVEIRWSHGRFCGFPEAKLYLDSRHNDVPGYFVLT